MVVDGVHESHDLSVTLVDGTDLFRRLPTQTNRKTVGTVVKVKLRNGSRSLCYVEDMNSRETTMTMSTAIGVAVEGVMAGHLRKTQVVTEAHGSVKAGREVTVGSRLVMRAETGVHIITR
jgi:hypothetical protein